MEFHKSTFSKYKYIIKNTWKCLKNVMGHKNSKTISSNTFLIDGNLTSDPGIIANQYNIFFINIGPA